MSLLGENSVIIFDTGAIMLKIASLVLFPLALGLGLKRAGYIRIASLRQKIQIINQILVLTIIWIGMSQGSMVILSGGPTMLPIIAGAAGYHLSLLLAAFATIRLLRIGPGRRESVIFMGTQKTLPLSIVLQVSLFPGYGLALVFCVVHHVVHLFIDAYLVGKLKSKKP